MFVKIGVVVFFVIALSGLEGDNQIFKEPTAQNFGEDGKDRFYFSDYHMSEMKQYCKIRRSLWMLVYI
jgi:hypothetical protein